MNTIEKEIDHFIAKGCRTISLDVFDTFLMRNGKPEVQRFFEVSKRHSQLFHTSGYPYSAKSLFAARMLAHKIGYRTAPMVGKYRDASIRHIFSIYLKYLKVTETDMLDRLIEIEIDYEKSNLKLNTTLYESVKEYKAQGINLYFISDMYLGKANIENLIDFFLNENFYKDVYVSSEFSAAKSTGLLFNIFLQNEKIRPEKLIHIGDNYKSDYLKPRELAINGIHLPLTRNAKISRYIKEIAVKTRLKKYLY